MAILLQKWLDELNLNYPLNPPIVKAVVWTLLQDVYCLYLYTWTASPKQVFKWEHIGVQQARFATRNFYAQ